LNVKKKMHIEAVTGGGQRALDDRLARKNVNA
jgi:hypothetical protein